MFISNKRRPIATETSIVPIPMAWMELPPNPLTIKGRMGLSDLKSLCSGDMWQFVPESRMKGMVPT